MEAAITLGEWVERETRDYRCSGGHTGGYEGWEKTSNNPQGQTKILWKSTEHNIDAYVAFTLLYELTGDSKWEERAFNAKNFVEAMWNDVDKHFWTGTLEDGCTINKSNIPVDIQAWALMALGSYNSALKWAEDNCYTESDGFKGFDFNNDRDGVWAEGTAQMAVAYQVNKENSKSDFYITELGKIQTSATNNNGKGIVAASHDGVTTGFDWEYFSRLHVGATAWYIFAGMKYNPYWGTRTVPIPDIKANTSDGPITIDTNDLLSVTVSLNAGSSSGEYADWWVAANTPWGDWFYYVYPNRWINAGPNLNNISYAYQGPLFNFNSFEILNISGLPVGIYTLYFGVDMNMNGSLDFDQLYYDGVVVNITQ
ncbi:MAG: hypothetical protein Q8P40_00765 [Nitrospirota bacterium]|nr:hypothetical protein [Nitrospirota bacterium]